MSSEQLATRILAQESKISGDKMRKAELSKDDFEGVIKKHRSGFIYTTRKLGEFDELLKTLIPIEKQLADTRQAITTLFKEDYQQLIKPATGKAHLLTLVYKANSFEQLFEIFKDKIKKDGVAAYMEKFTERQLQPTLDYLALEATSEELREELTALLKLRSIAFVDEKVTVYKKSKAVFTFDDLIRQVHRAVVGDKAEEIKKALINKYHAFFIYVFLDTY